MNKCPRCGSPNCNDPDSKACSDNIITKRSAECIALTSRVAALERETIERCGLACDVVADKYREGMKTAQAAGLAGTAQMREHRTWAADECADAVRALALRATEQQQQGEP